MSNFSVAVRRGGEIWLSMAKDVYVEPGRKMKGVGPQNEVAMVELMKPAIGPDGEVIMDNDLSEARFDVVATVGPSSQSQRAATVRSLLGMLQLVQDPQTQQVLLAMAFQNMEGEGISDVRSFFRNQMVKAGILKPTDEEAQALAAAMQNAQPDPQAQYLQAAAAEAMAKASKAQADVVKTVADSELVKAKTVETLARLEMDDQKAAIDAAKGVIEVIRGGPVPQ
jgi:hypothetical protein